MAPVTSKCSRVVENTLSWTILTGEKQSCSTYTFQGKQVLCNNGIKIWKHFKLQKAFKPVINNSQDFAISLILTWSEIINCNTLLLFCQNENLNPELGRILPLQVDTSNWLRRNCKESPGGYFKKKTAEGFYPCLQRKPNNSSFSNLTEYKRI